MASEMNIIKTKALRAIEIDNAEALAELMANARLASNKAFLCESIHAAASGHSVNCLCFLVEAGVSIDSRNKSNWTALHCAAFDNDVEAAHILVAAGADLEANCNGDTPYVLAVERRSADVAEFLITSGANVRPRPDTPRITAGYGASGRKFASAHPVWLQLSAQAYQDETYTLWHAAYDDNVVALKQMLDEFDGENNLLYAQDEQGRTPLHWAVIPPSSRCVSFMFSCDHECKLIRNIFHLPFVHFIDSRDYDGNMPLHLAVSAHHKNLQCVQFLLDHGAPINSKNALLQTPLHMALCSFNEDAAILLMKHGADIHAKDSNGHTPLDLAEGKTQLLDYPLVKALEVMHQSQGTKTTLLYNAVVMNDFENVRAILHSGLDSINSYKGHDTPLHGACSAEMAELLIAFGADVNGSGCSSSVEYGTPLHTRHLEVARVLLEHGADVDGGGSSQSRLHIAAQFPDEHNDELAILDILLAAGARIDARDSFSATPLHRAAEGGSLAAVERLIAHGAEVNAQDEKGSTPLDYAVEEEHHNIAATECVNDFETKK